MYNFSGIIYRVVGVAGFILLVGVVCILLEKPWASGFKLQNCKIGIALIIISVCFGLVYISRILFPNVLSYTGEFVDSNRNSRVAPPLPVTYQYVFSNGEGDAKVVYLDLFSKKEVFQGELERGTEYTVYYDEFTKVIVKIEINNNN